MAERYRCTLNQREDIRRRQAETGTSFTGGSEEQLRARAERLLREGEFGSDAPALVPSDGARCLPSSCPDRPSAGRE